MIIPFEKARLWYDHILRRIKKLKKGKIIIFLSFSLDSLTSIRILVNLFKSDIIPYEIIPIENFSELTENIEKLKKSNIEIVGIIFINCIGENDLTQFWFMNTLNKINCLITDNRRPIHHKNIHDNKIITIINDEYYNYEFCPSNEEIELFDKDRNIMENENEESEKEEKDEDEKEEENYLKFDEEKKKEENKNNDEDKKEEEEKEENKENENKNNNIEENKEEQKKVKKRKLKKKHASSKENSFEDIEKDIDSILSQPSKKKSENSNDEEEEEEKEEKLTPQQEYQLKLKKIKTKIDTYYSGSYYGLPSTLIFYFLSRQLNKNTLKGLFLLIISITSEYLFYHISEEIYNKLYYRCVSEYQSLNKKKNKEIDKDLGEFQSSGKNVGSLQQIEDIRLILYRHWNLYDSLIYSNYTLSVLSSWKEPGKNEIQKILAYLGIPLNEAKQNYRHMKKEFQDSFSQQLTDISNKFDLKELIFHSFLYNFNMNIDISASDICYILESLLEYPYNDINIEMEENDIEDINRKDINLKLKNFWMAYKFLSLKNLNMFNNLIEVAIKFQQALCNNATSLIDKNSIQQSTYFRYCICSTNLAEESRYFHSPLNLEKLSNLIMEIYIKKRGKNYEKKPFLLSYLNSENKSYICVGILNNNKKYEEERNDFGIRFNYVSNKKKIKIKRIFNNEDIVEINKDDLYAFISEMSNI